MKSRVANIVERALSTFWQGAILSLITAASATNLANVNLPALRAIGLSALGAGIGAVLSVAKNLTATLAADHAASQQAAVLTDAAAPLRYANGGIVTEPAAWQVTMGPSQNTTSPAAPDLNPADYPMASAAPEPTAPATPAKRSHKAKAKPPTAPVGGRTR